MTRRWLMLVVAAVVVTVAAVTAVLVLGGGDEPVRTSTASPVTAQQVADRLNCAGYEPVTDGTEMFVREQAHCRLSGDLITLYTFSSGDARANWVQAATSLGSGVIVVGDQWVVAVADQSVGEQVQAVLGGQIR